ncbi:hypothetical protein FRC03_008158 [Tulasnella sp. 419]|nr:hypothetical protein FRC03_008158 [Tulasnella sp. 419]
MSSKNRKGQLLNGQHDTPVPSNWPSSVIYLTRPRYCSNLPTEILTKIRGASYTRKGTSQSSTQAPWAKIVKIQEITSPAHPAHGQRGLFAIQKIPPNTHVLDYYGEIHADERYGSDYDLCLTRFRLSEDEFVSVGIDAQFMGNEARFINDYRATGISKPNAEFRERTCENGELRMSVWSGSKGIKKGDEILVSYGKGWWKARNGDNPESSFEIA